MSDAGFPISIFAVLLNLSVLGWVYVEEISKHDRLKGGNCIYKKTPVYLFHYSAFQLALQ